MKYEDETQIRKDFARLFGWTEKKNQYDYGELSPRTPEWSEIFCKVGKLLTESKTLSDEYRFVAIEDRIVSIEQEICKQSSSA